MLKYQDKIHFFTDGISSGISQLKTVLQHSEGHIRDMLKEQNYSFHDEEQILDFLKACRTDKIIVAEKLYKDWNDILKYSTNYQYLLTQDLQTFSANKKSIEDEILRTTQKLGDDSLFQFQKRTQIDLEILQIMQEKGFIRENKVNGDIAYIWSKNNKLVGVKYDYSNNSRIIGVKDNSIHDSFIFT